ncbi:cytochrome c biogenesis CcdA family protein [Leekyejoonella antrihumi]|uniref:Cytochrome c biogenesis protein CcdA n=1 Tax=Leekyejoonella antrihumi TaxID=1660198 RepID=A0A563DWU5_9MICO|nr:cytochrome c biogenesis protein CcdA [Leekyejoonella antrihumi]TWP34697.1 cytochrome c biogenesis protein CcdA [Leekyejoonella antrihumi]
MHADAATMVASGSLPLAIALSVLAGAVSFASPCVLPLVPGFLGYVTGLTDERRRTRLVTGAFLFVVGFSVVMVGLAATYGWAMDLTRAYRGATLRIGGVLVILLALVYLGFIGQRGVAVRWKPTAGLVGAPLLGVVFGIGMSPCIGPVYGSILVMASPIGGAGSTVTRGIILAAFYSLGLGVPFMLIAAGWTRAERASRWLRNHHRPVQLIGGGLMLAVGVLMVAGVWEHFIVWIQTSLVGVDGFKPVI